MDEAFSHLESKGGRQFKRGKAPPDGGWGYMICIGVGFTFMLGFGSSNAFGILFNNFFLEQNGASGLPLVIGVYNGALSIAGFLSGIALKKYSFRQVGLVGAGLFVLGDILTIFVQRTYQLVFTFGVIRGAGFGVMIPVSFTAFNCYFTKKRTAMMSANQSMSSMASITFPILVTYLLAEYGFRWTLALIMAMDLHLLFAMIIMHPVEWHLIDVDDEKKDTDIPLKSDIRHDGKQNPEYYDESIVKMLPGDEMGTQVETKHVNGKPRTKPHQSIQKRILTTIYENVDLDLLKNPRFLSTLVGLGFAFVSDVTTTIYENVDLDLLKNPRFLSTLVGLGFAFVSDVTYLAMEPMLLFSYGFSKIEVATCVMAGALADLLARFSLAIFTYFYSVDSRKLFFGGTVVTVFLRIVLVTSSDLTFVFIVTVISGLVRCSVQVLFPLVLATAAPDRFPAALALHILFSGSLMLLADPLIGIIYDATGSYTYCFYALSFCCSVCVVLWTVEFFIYRRKKT